MRFSMWAVFKWFNGILRLRSSARFEDWCPVYCRGRSNIEVDWRSTLGKVFEIYEMLRANHFSQANCDTLERMTISWFENHFLKLHLNKMFWATMLSSFWGSIRIWAISIVTPGKILSLSSSQPTPPLSQYLSVFPCITVLKGYVPAYMCDESTSGHMI